MKLLKMKKFPCAQPFLNFPRGSSIKDVHNFSPFFDPLPLVHKCPNLSTQSLPKTQDIFEKIVMIFFIKCILWPLKKSIDYLSLNPLPVSKHPLLTTSSPLSSGADLLYGCPLDFFVYTNCLLLTLFIQSLSVVN